MEVFAYLSSDSQGSKKRPKAERRADAMRAAVDSALEQNRNYVLFTSDSAMRKVTASVTIHNDFEVKKGATLNINSDNNNDNFIIR